MLGLLNMRRKALRIVVQQPVGGAHEILKKNFARTGNNCLNPLTSPG